MKHIAIYMVRDSNDAGPDHTPIAVGDQTVWIRGEIVETPDDENYGRDSLSAALERKRMGEHMLNTHRLDSGEDSEQS
jgi:hypothetical protein